MTGGGRFRGRLSSGGAGVGGVGGAGVGVRVGDEVTDLVYAAIMGKVLRVRDLLGVGLSDDASDSTVATERNRRRQLLRKVDRKSGFQPIHGAVYGVTERNLEVVEALLSVAEEEAPALDGGPMEPLLAAKTKKTGNTALHIACARGDEKLVKLLLDRGADARAENLEGLVPFDVAFKYQNWAAAEEVLRGDQLGKVASRQGSRPRTLGQTRGYWCKLYHSKGHAVFYVLFLVFLCWSVVLQTQRSRDVYFLSHLVDDKLMEEEFGADDAPNVKKVFEDIGEVTEFWQWLRGPLAGTLSNPDWRSEREVEGPGTGFIHGHNRLVGPVRLRQLRVRKDSCTWTRGLVGDVSRCYNHLFR